MQWKLKAFIQNCVACLPKKLSYEMYFQIQRHFGNLKKPFNPLRHFSAGVTILKKIQQSGNNFIGKTFFEVGTGRVPLLPIALWLGGAGNIITVDLNPYMRNELIMDMLLYIKTKENDIKNIFGTLLDKNRFNLLLDYSRKKKVHKKEILELCQIKYIAPGNAAKINLPDNSIEYHISNKVYEHIPLTVISDILEEGNRIISEDGLFINNINYGDHFSYMDKTISEINFLRYSDKEWEKYAGNRYMYMNRARHDDFVALFTGVGHDFLEIEPRVSKKVEQILSNNEIVLDIQFQNKSKEILSIMGSIFITRKSKSKKNGI
jgi:ubiquinone/menaquinone biosynthesis C-methylase UbiE